MRRHGPALAGILLILLLAGCTRIVNDSWDPELSMNVVHSWNSNSTLTGREPVSGDHWIYLLVNMTCNNSEMAHPISVPHFFAWTAKGERLWCYDAEGLDDPLIAPSSFKLLTIYFMVPDGALLVRLEYTPRVSGPVECPIPAPDR